MQFDINVTNLSELTTKIDLLTAAVKEVTTAIKAIQLVQPTTTVPPTLPPPNTTPLVPPTLPSVPSVPAPPSVPSVSASGLPTAIDVATVDKYKRYIVNVSPNGLSFQMTIPAGWVGRGGFTFSPTVNDPAAQSASYMLRILNQAGGLVYDSGFGPAGSISFADATTGAVWDTKLQPGVYTVVYVSTAPSQTSFEFHP